MGAGATRENVIAKERSRNIDSLIQEERQRLDSRVKLLLLGSSESGKSTLVKQMKILHRNGFSKEERNSYKHIVIDNLIMYTTMVIEAMAPLQIEFEDPQCQRMASMFLSHAKAIEKSVLYLQELYKDLSTIYKDQGFQECVKHGYKYCLGDSAVYLFQSIERLASENYVPTDKDILFARMPTSGIIEMTFKYKRYRLCVVDVGGQKSERRKWIHCFDDVTAVLFVVAMSCYDQTLDDDSKKNKLIESLELFETINRNSYFKKSGFIVFLNKKDVFQEKIKSIPLRTHFPKYPGKNTYDETSDYIRRQFEKRVFGAQDFYSHYTNATDTSNIDCVFNIAMDIILNKNLEETGFA